MHQASLRPVEAVIERLARLSEEGSLTTGQVRGVSAEEFRRIESKTIENVLSLCRYLLEQRKWELGVVAYDWAYKMRRDYSEDTFRVFEGWLKQYVTGWGDCDDFCTHAFGELLSQFPKLFPRVVQWTGHGDFWVRRAAAVILIYPIRKGRSEGLDPFTIVDKLLYDEHHLVLKGYGWMLKVLSSVRPAEVQEYLMRHKESMPRVAFRYAIEKYDKETKAILMA